MQALNRLGELNTTILAWILETSIVNNFLTRDVQTKNRIVLKCANKNIFTYVILNVISVFRILEDLNLPRLTVLKILIVNNFSTRDVQTKHQIVSKYANENLSICAILNDIIVFRTYLSKPTILGR